ncbi:hypothetical protein NliqN6_6704 [Naganishia liquefaciens]|uniref:Uncharacterized protein n=1 Tax=Naganishia liquefaciens TaxID=104408 RepID=A0A8H3U077_9TREE|nr:hypothetical protein NliqN6_6704 [Naganishia liquefaciens]
MSRPGDRDRERYDRGRPRSPEPYGYLPPSNYRSPRSRSPDYYGSRSHYSSRTGGYYPSDARSQRPSPRSPPRARSRSRGPSHAQQTPKAQSDRSASRPRNDPPSRSELQRSNNGPCNSPREAATTLPALPCSPSNLTNNLKRPDVVRSGGVDGNANDSAFGPSSEASSSKTPIVPSRPVDASSQGASSSKASNEHGRGKRPRSPDDTPAKRKRPSNVPRAASSSNPHQTLAASSRSTTPASAVPAESGTTVKHEASGTGQSRERPPSSKRARSKSVGPSSKAKAKAAGGEQEAKGRTGSRTGDQVLREKGKAAIYHSRVDPHILHLVKGVYALYNAEAKVDRLRLETSELEKSLGTPLQEMSPEDQEAVRELVNEFGQNRDQAKKERDITAYTFMQAARPVLKLLLDEVLPGALAEIGPANAKLKVDRPANGKPIVEKVDTGKVKPTSSNPTGDAEASERKTEGHVVNADREGKGTGLPDGLAYTPHVPSTSAVEVADASVVDQALGMTESAVPMEVDGEAHPPSVPAHTGDLDPSKQPALTPTSLPLTESAPAQQPSNAEQPFSTNHITTAQNDGGSLESPSGRRLPAVRRLKNLESGLETVSSTAEELVRKVEKLEEQMLYQEEQLNDYLDTRGLMETMQLDARKPPNSTTTPATVAPPAPLAIKPSASTTSASQIEASTETPALHSLLPSGLVDMSTVEAAGEATCTIDQKFESLAKMQDAKLAELAQLQETRLLSLGDQIRSEIQAEAARAEEAYAGAVAAAEEKASLLEAQLAKLQAELASYKEDRKMLEDILKRQGDADVLLDGIRGNSLKHGVLIRQQDGKIQAADEQLQKHDIRLSELNERLDEQTMRLSEHDRKISVMSPFENTKEAWRSDMIDMKNHVIGRVDYLEEQVESIKQPLVAARLATQGGETSTTARQRIQPQVPTAQIAHQTRRLTPQAIVPSPPQMAATQAPALPGLSMPAQGRLSPAVEGATNRLMLNRTVGQSPSNSPAPAAQPQPLPAIRSGLPGYNAALERPQVGGTNGAFAANSPVPNQARLAWPASSNTPSQLQPASRVNGFPVETDINPDSALVNRLYSNQQTRQESLQGALPLHLRMHDGPGGTMTGNWAQAVQPAQASSGSAAAVRPSPGTGDNGGPSLLARMYDPGESKPTLQ